MGGILLSKLTTRGQVEVRVPEEGWLPEEPIQLVRVRKRAQVKKWEPVAEIQAPMSGGMDIVSPSGGEWVPLPIPADKVLQPGDPLGYILGPYRKKVRKASRRSPGAPDGAERGTGKGRTGGHLLEALEASQEAQTEAPPNPEASELPTGGEAMVATAAIEEIELFVRVQEAPDPLPPPPYARAEGESTELLRHRYYVTEAQRDSIKGMVSALSNMASKESMEMGRISEAEVLRTIVEEARSRPVAWLMAAVLRNRETESREEFGTAARVYE